MTRIGKTIASIVLVVASFQLRAFAQKVEKCTAIPPVYIHGDSKHQTYTFRGKQYDGFPLDEVADYEPACHETELLIIVADPDVPVHIMFEAAGSGGKLQVQKSRVFIRVRDHYNELTLGDETQILPVNK